MTLQYLPHLSNGAGIATSMIDRKMSACPLGMQMQKEMRLVRAASLGVYTRSKVMKTFFLRRGTQRTNSLTQCRVLLEWPKSNEAL